MIGANAIGNGLLNKTDGSIYDNVPNSNNVSALVNDQQIEASEGFTINLN